MKWQHSFPLVSLFFTLLSFAPLIGYLPETIAASGQTVAASENVNDFQPIEAWTVAYDGQYPHSQDTPYGIVLDADDNVIVTGYSDEYAKTPCSWATIKYDAGGRELWRQYFGDTSNGSNCNNQAFDIEVDSFGGIYVTGMTENDHTTGDYTLLKYDPDGNESWATVFAELGYHSYGTNLARIDEQYLAVTGTAFNSSGKIIWVTMKFDLDGEVQWTAVFQGSDNFFWPKEIAADSAGNIYVAGTDQNEDPQYPSPDFFVIKYNSDGEQQWTARYDGPVHGEDNLYDMVVSAQGDVIVTGSECEKLSTTYHSCLQDGAIVLKYDTDGELQWAKTFVGPEYSSYVGFSIATDETGASYIAGKAKDYDTAETLLLKYDQDGDLLWSRKENPFSGEDGAILRNIAQVGEEYLICTGYFSPYQSRGAWLPLGFIQIFDLEGNSSWLKPRLDFFTLSYPDETTLPLIATNGTDHFSLLGTKNWEEWDFVITKYGLTADCLIDGSPYLDGQVNPSNDCQVCDSALNPDEWSTVENGFSCDDGLFCNGADSCLSGECATHSGNPCSVEEICQELTDECIPLSDDDTSADDDVIDDDDNFVDDDDNDDDDVLDDDATPIDDDYADDETPDDDNAADDDAINGDDDGGGCI